MNRLDSSADGAVHEGHRSAFRRLAVRAACIVLLLTPFVPRAIPQAGALKLEDVHIGAFDADAWNGIVFDASVRGQAVPFALRIGSKGYGSPAFLDGERIYSAVNLVGPHAPDGSYAKVGWRHAPRMSEVMLEWSRIDETTVVGRISAPSEVSLVLETYGPGAVPFMGTYNVGPDGMEISGEHRIEGYFGASARFSLAIDHTAKGAAVFPNVAQLRAALDTGELPGITPQSVARQNDDRRPRGAAGLELTAGATGELHFVAAIGMDGAALKANAGKLLQPGAIDAILNRKAADYTENQPQVRGLFAGSPQAIASSMFWNTLYVPALDLEFPGISRHWDNIFGGWALGEWDCFLGSLLTDGESPRQTSAAVRAILMAQQTNGVVPNVASGAGTTPDRSQPPVGAYAVLKDFRRDGNLELLRWAYPRLKKWHAWWFADRGDGQPWRDGNRDGLLEWGSDRGTAISHGGRGTLLQARFESGMDDSPLYDDVTYNPATYTMDMDDVGLNSLYALDAECLGEMAKILHEEDDSRAYAAEYSRMSERVRSQLWNEQDGMFENRFWNGAFSKRLGPSNFYPMLAGIATPAQERRMVDEHLLNPREFWGDYVIPTIARDEPAFTDQYYWRGDIWPPTNYLVSEGLDRYREDKVALEFADKSYRLFMDDWSLNQHTDEQYYAWGGSAGGDTHYTWGALLCLIAMNQFIAENPWDGLRFGALDPTQEGTLTHVVWGTHRYDISVGPNGTAMTRDGILRFQADAGVVVRSYEVSVAGVSFELHSTRGVSVTTSEFAGGKLTLRVDDRPARLLGRDGGSASFAVDAGVHSIRLSTQAR